MRLFICERGIDVVWAAKTRWSVTERFRYKHGFSGRYPAVSIARARVTPGVTTRRHRLAGITERYVILEGNGRVDVSGMTSQPVGPGDVVLIPPGCSQRITNTGRVDLVFLAVCTPRFVPEAYGDLDGDPAHD